MTGVCHPWSLATKISPEVPPYLPNLNFPPGPVAAPRGPTISSLPPPPVPGGVRGEVRPYRPLRPKFCQGFPPSFQNPIFFLAHCFSLRAPSHFPAPLPVPISVCGGVRPLQSCRPKIFQGFPPVGPKFWSFYLGPLREPPCAVAPDQGGHAYEGACCTGEVGEGDVGGQYHSGVLIYWGGTG